MAIDGAQPIGATIISGDEARRYLPTGGGTIPDGSTIVCVLKADAPEVTEDSVVIIGTEEFEVESIGGKHDSATPKFELVCLPARR